MKSIRIIPGAAFVFMTAISPISPAYAAKAASASTSKSGTISNSNNGAGTTSKTIVIIGVGDRTVTETRTFANGAIQTNVDNVVKNTDGSVTQSMTKVLPNGKTLDRNITISQNPNGPKTLTGTNTNENTGVVQTLSGKITTTPNGEKTQITAISSTGKIAHYVNIEKKNSHAATIISHTGTGFGGKTLDYTAKR